MLQPQSLSPFPGLPLSDYLITDSNRPAEVVEDALLRCGLTREAFVWNDLVLQEGERIELPCEAQRLPGGIIEVASNNIDAFKRCVGFDDEEVRSGPKSVHPRMPSRKRLDPAKLRDITGLTQKQADELIIAGDAYLYGDSTRTRDWRELLEQRYAPFRVSVVAARRIVLPAGADMLVHVYPTLLIAEELVFAGGSLTINSKARIHVGQVIKKEERLS